MIELGLIPQAAENNLARQAGIARAERGACEASGIGGITPARNGFENLESGFAGR